jgi:hypothetical protein
MASRLNMPLRVAKMMIAEFLEEANDVAISTSKSLQEQVDAVTARFEAWQASSEGKEAMLVDVELVNAEQYSANVDTELREKVTSWLVKAMARRKELLDKCGDRVTALDKFHVTYSPMTPEMNVTCAYEDQSCLEEVPDELNGEKSMHMVVKGHPAAIEMLQQHLGGIRRERPEGAKEEE